MQRRSPFVASRIFLTIRASLRRRQGVSTGNWGLPLYEVFARTDPEAMAALWTRFPANQTWKSILNRAVELTGRFRAGDAERFGAVEACFGTFHGAMIVEDIKAQQRAFLLKDTRERAAACRASGKADRAAAYEEALRSLEGGSAEGEGR
jgi:hypothetical protein